MEHLNSDYYTYFIEMLPIEIVKEISIDDNNIKYDKNNLWNYFK